MKKLLVALDTSPVSSTVLAEAMDQARAHNAKLVLLRVVGLPTELPLEAYAMAPDDVSRLIETSARKDLDRLCATVPAELVQSTRTVIGTPWRTICDVAKEEDVAMIIMGAHGHRWVDSVMGTNSTRVVNNADRTVLVVRGPAKT